MYIYIHTSTFVVMQSIILLFTEIIIKKVSRIIIEKHIKLVMKGTTIPLGKQCCVQHVVFSNENNLKDFLEMSGTGAHYKGIIIILCYAQNRLNILVKKE